MSEPRLTAGVRLGGFEVLEFLNHGGMGAVYVARDVSTNARVALKVLGEASAADTVRFEREGRIAARLEHPHIVTGLGHGRTAEGLAWLAMELLRGQDLDLSISRAQLPVAEAVALAGQVCEALEYAHVRGVVHRDLKPSNIFVCEGPTLHVKVLDFGIARLLNEKQYTRTGVPIGTLAYMSPEQARGESDIDPRTDLWSLGVVLFECLTGVTPFVAESPIGFLYKIMESAAPDLAALRPDLPHALVSLVNKTLSKARDGRPVAARVMREMLADIGPLVGSLAGAEPRQRVSGAESAATIATDSVAMEPELRLVTAVVLRGVRDPVFVQRVATELGGRLEKLATGGHLCLFGVDRWLGDEPQRATRLTATVAPHARGIGVVTDRVLRSAAHIAGAAVDAAARLAERDGAHLDANTLAFTRDEFVLSTRIDGSATIDPRGSVEALSVAPPNSCFVGRDTELGVLLDSVAASAREQRIRVVTVLGGSGIGKSRLRQETSRDLSTREPTATLLMARCEIYRRATPFAALRDALLCAGDPGATAVFSTTSPMLDPQAEIDGVRASLETVLAGLSERGPVVLAFDDAQWLDASSRSALRWLCDNAPYLPLTLWLFARPDARDALREVASDGTVLQLAPLSRSHSERLLRSIAGTAPDALLERADGHPLFLEELGRLYAEHGAASLTGEVNLPVSVEGAQLAQLDLIDPADREFIKRAAVFGRSAWVEGVIALGGAADAMPRLVRANLAVPRGRSRFAGAREFAFRTGTLHDVAYGLLPAPQRARLHAVAAGWLSERATASADELARHWDLAGDKERAAVAYAAAAEVAASVADTAATESHCARVLALTQDPELRFRALVAQDTALQLGSDPEKPRAGLVELCRLAEGLTLRHRVEASWRGCYFARMSSDRAMFHATGGRALALAQELGDPRWSAAVNIEMALFAMREARVGDARVHATLAWESAVRLDDPWLKARACAARAYVAGETGDSLRALELYEMAADGFVRAGDRRREAIARANAGFFMMELGRTEEAERQIASSIESAQRVGNLATVAMSTHNLGVVRRILGDLAGALQFQGRAAELGHRLGLAKVKSEVATERVYLALAMFESPEDCVRCAQSAGRLADEAGAPQLVISALVAGLRAGARAGRASVMDLSAARRWLDSSHGLGRAELLVALYDACGRQREDGDAAREAIETYLARLDSPEDRAASGETFLRRYLVPESIAPEG